MLSSNPEETIKKNEDQLLKLLLQIEDLKKETSQLFEQMNMTPEQFAAYVADKTNFSPSEWEILQEQHKKLDEKLTLSLDNIRNPKKMHQAYQDLNASRNWLFVK